ncbi:MAG: cell surface protein SprA [Ignavibacteria bacterium]|nr:cell surface protein SprA [Ignavibacteria bacterium]MBT8392845.1 cell surface protein SprA [Ignavibacteria bacterium]NNJ52451.1 cell surface protein SprA [Ignavibacteriaceae bacterium]
MNQIIWFDACFKTISAEHVNKVFPNESSNLSSRTEQQITSLKLPDDVVLYNSNGPENDYEYFPSDSGLTTPLDSTLLLTDSTIVIDDSSVTSIDSSLFANDSLKIPLDSLIAEEDTVEIDWREIDSTARSEQFKYSREDQPYVELKEKKKSKFFIDPSQNLSRRTLQLAQDGEYVEIRELLGSQETKVLLRMPIDDYIQMKLAINERAEWEKMGYAYELKESTVGLSELITSFTDFEIPLPSVGVLSIFGEPKISLKIGGAVQIHGAWRSETTEGVTASRLGNTRNEPDFKQQVQINVSGTIGDKLNISADWNTERTFEYENQLKIKYTGYEDEIIQSIEAGNVSMQTPSLIGGAEALFGVKALFKMGPFSLTTLASQKKGETKEVSVSSGSTAKEYEIRAYDYSETHYFVDTLYASPFFNIFENFYSNIPAQVSPEVQINEIEVWKSINVITADKSKERFANCYIDLPVLPVGQNTYADSLREPLENPIQGKEETGRFLLLSQDIDYTLHPETGYISFKTSINDQDIIAVSYKQGNSDLTYGEFLATSTDTILVLKLVKPKYLKPTYTDAWKLQLKNIYPTGSRNVKQEGFEFKIKYELVGQDPVDELVTPAGETVRFLEAFGLDQIGAGGNPNPDNIFDWRPGLTIFPETGEIIFPTLQPFGKDIPPVIDTLKFQTVYDTTKTYARQDKRPDKWVMAGKNTGDVTSTYQLGFNVVENSVKVILNGRELKEGVDFVVDYNIGQLTIRNDAALVPGADLKITYEQNDLFQLASKTLLGARGLYEFSDKTQLGFTVMNLNQQTLSDKVRIGEEPLSNTILGADFRTSADLPFLTDVLDLAISTKEMSTFSFNGEYAYMSPDPNTKKSTIPEDGGKSIAYIDDFEGAKRTIPVGVNYTGWKDLSPPDRLPLLPPNLTRQERMQYKAKGFWYTITPSDVVVDSIYGGRKKVARSDQQVSVLDYVFLPDTPGTFNWTPNLLQPELTWGGTQRLLSSTANNLVEQNIEFVEFWMKIVDAPENSSLYLDLGLISEDVIPNNRLDTEDKNFNDAIDEGEDTGIDGLFDPEERIEYNSTKSDPSGDNFTFSGNPLSVFDYFSINGTEGNAVLTDVGLLPDTEDLNRNGNVDLANSYFRYEIPLDTSSLTNKFISGGGFTPAGWYLYRIPLKDTSAMIGSPSLSNVETIRFFTHGVSDPIHIRLTEFNLVGSQWQKLLVEDTVLSVSVVSFEESPDYESPPGVFREVDRTRPDEDILRNEQSLNLILKDLEEGTSREAVKYLFRPLDVFNYTEMKLYIHGDENYDSLGSVSYLDSSSGKYSSEVFFRFGTDTQNYYEYRQPVVYNLNPSSLGWNSISIKFSELTAVKQAPADSSGNIKVPVEGRPGHFYILKGNPTLTSVKFLSVGVFNIDDPDFNPGPLSGEVWINELRVVGADDSPGWAYTFNTSLKFADLMTVNFNMSKTNPFFHRLSERFGSRVENQNWTVSTDLDVMKLIPFNMRESNLRINFSHSESLGKPLYIPGTDVRVDEAVRQLEENPDTTSTNVKTADQLILETQTLNVSNSISTSNVRLKIPTDLWYIRDTWNALSFGFNFNNRFSRSPTVTRSKYWIWNANMNYALNFSPDLFIKLADIPVIGLFFSIFDDYKDVKLYFAPQNLSATLSASRNRNSSLTRPINNVNPQAAISKDFTSSRNFAFNWRLTEGGLLNFNIGYNLNINSSLAYLLEDIRGMERTESDIWSDIFGGASFGRDYKYTQSFDLRTSPRLPSLWDINRYFTLTAGYSVGYRWDFDLRQETTGRSAGYNRRFTAGMILRWKSLTEPLFGTDETPESNTDVKKDIEGTDSTTVTVDDTKPSSISKAFTFLKLTVKAIFFDWENFNVNFSHDNSVSKSGIKSTGTGFSNFWGLLHSDAGGPSRAFQLGLSSDVGPRAFDPEARTNFTDNFSEKNSIDLKTARPLWEGAKLDINWNVNWSMNKTTTLTFDDFGNIQITNTTSTGSLTRSFLSLPPSLPFVDSGIKKVNALYNPNSEDPRASLSQAFVDGFETLPWLSSLPMFQDVKKFIPRPNWRITWDGLEKLLFFKSLAERISLDHAYSSTYTEGWKLSREGNQEIQTQRIEYGFTPFAGLNITFGELWGGNLSGSIKFSSRTTYDLGLSTNNINETLSSDIGFTATYSKSGFEVPLFGVSLKNDIEFLISYTSTKNSIVRFEMDNFTEEGIPQDGTTRTTIEPRIKYTISSKVSLSIFYKRSTVEPEGAARIPPTTTNEAGLDVNITIQ